MPTMTQPNDAQTTVRTATYETGFGPGRVLLAGPDDGPTVVLVHGYAASADQWRRLIPYLAGHYRIIAPDLLGFADAPAPATRYSPRLWAAQLGRLFDVLAVPRAVLIGHSLGGLVTLTMAHHHPERVAGLVLVNSLGRPTPHVEMAFSGAAGVVVRLLRAPGLGETIFWGLRGQPHLARALAYGAYHDQTRAPEDVLDTWFALIYRPNAHRAYLGFVRQLERLVVPFAPGEIAQPTLIVWGKEDRGLPVQLAHDFLELLPQAAVAIIPDCGHMPHSERADATAAVVLPFLATVLKIGSLAQQRIDRP